MHEKLPNHGTRFHRVFRMFMLVLGCEQKFTPEEMARELSVTKRSVFRYLELLKDFGVVIDYDESGKMTILELAIGSELSVDRATRNLRKAIEKNPINSESHVNPQRGE